MSTGFAKEDLVGVWPAIPLPWQDEETLDTGLFKEIIARYKAAGCHGVYTTGTDGELHALDFPDFAAMVDAFAAGVHAADIKAQVGTTWLHTRGVVQRARYAWEQGIRCQQVALPFWVTLNDTEVKTFFAALTEACPEMGIVHYNVAKVGRFFLGRDYRLALSVAPNLWGSKHTGGNVSDLMDAVAATPELHHFVVDHQLMPGYLLGARGFYSFVANLNPHFAVAFYNDCVQGNHAEATRKKYLMDRFFKDWRALMTTPLSSQAMGKIATRCGIAPEIKLIVRSPYQAGTEADVDRFRALLDRYPELRYRP